MRSVVGALLLVVSIVVAPVAAIGTWARLQVVDTERFVQTLAPLASDPGVQEFIADQVTEAIDDQVNLDAAVADAFDGIRSLGLPPQADAALGLLEAPAASGARTLIDNVVRDVIASDRFAAMWTEALRVTHDRGTDVIRGAPGTAVVIDGDGVISIELGVVIERVTEALQERGVAFADLIPAIDRSVPIAQAEALAPLRTLFDLADVGGFWLPWAVLGLAIAGIALLKNRPRGVLFLGAGFAAVFLLLSAGLGVARRLFVAQVSPAVMPAATAETIFGQLTSLLVGTVAALVFLGVLVALWGWFAGTSRPAVAVRGLLGDGFAGVRGFAEERGVSTGRFGRGVERFRIPLLLAGVVVGIVVLIADRPVTFGTTVGVAVGLILWAVLIELLRRPEP